ncbi:hypothetical protein ACGC1H_001950 [Rhizoctonia solani]
MSYYDSRNRIRLRISEIRLQPSISERAIKVKIFVDGVFIKELPSIERGQPLKWSDLNIIQTSRLELALYERQYRKHSQYDSDSCLVSELEGIVTKMLKIQGTQYSAELTILDQTQAEELFAKSREKLGKIGQTGGANDKFKNTQRMFKSMLEFGSAVAELNPIAKTVLAVCTRAWERLEEQQKSGEELDDLARGLAGMVPLVDEVKKYAQLESLRQNLEEFLRMIEDVSIFVLERKTKGFVVQAFRSVFDSSDRDQVEELVKRFQKTKSDFDMAVGVQTMAMVATADERELLKQLNPVEPSGHDPSRGCQDGTRLGVLGYIDDWTADQTPSSTFMWIYGQAGIGKSTILTSVCNRLSEKGIPIVSFFCKRDDPALRDPLRLINSVVHGLACRYPPYGKRVAKAIEANSELCTSHLRVRYQGLLRKPLSGIENVPPQPYFVLIDAMDECGADDNRRQLMEHLLELSSLVPWLKVIITSRPDSDIRSFFDQPNTMSVSRCDLQSYSAANDIRAFINVTLNDIAIRDEWPADGVSRLCTKAGELFIWAATACKFIIKADDTRDRFRQLINENTSGGGFNGLDALYMAVIRNSMADQADDSILNMRRCIGAIVTISMRQPVPIEVLCEIMQPYMKSGPLRKVVGRLGAVVYSDAHLAGAIRVLHPSFADFVLDEARSSIFWVDPIERNIEISVGCMSTMEHELRFNICDLETSHLLNREVRDLESKIEANISGQLAYSCVYWINHVVDCDDKATARLVANILDNPRLLYWLEVLSVLRRVDVAVQGLRELSRWLMLYQRDIAHYVWDAYRFVFAFSDAIITSAPHIYISALPLAPKQSEVSRRLLPLFPNTAMVEGGDETWPEWLRAIPLPARLCSLNVSRDSQRLAVSSCKHHDEPATISIFDLKTGGLLRVLEHSSADNQPEFVIISADGSLVVAGSVFRVITFWDAETGTVIYSVQSERLGHRLLGIRAWVLSPGNALRLLVGGGLNNRITIWEIEPRKAVEVPLLEMDIGSRNVAVFSPDGGRVAIGSHDGRLVLYSWPGPVEIMQFDSKAGHTLNVVVFSPNGALIAAASGTYDKRGVQIWDTKTGTTVGTLMEHNTRVSSMAFSSDGAQMIISAGGTLQMWDTKTCAAISSAFGVHSAHSIYNRIWTFFSPDDTYILSGSLNDTKIRMWDIPSNSTLIDNRIDTARAPKHTSHLDAVGSVFFSLGGTCIISGSYDCTVRTWDAQTGVAIEKLTSINSPVREVTLSLDGAWIMAATTGWGSKLYIWNTRIAAEPSVRHNICSFALSPDGNYLVTGSYFSPEMIVWNINTGSMVKRLRLAHGQLCPEFITFSLDGSDMFSDHDCVPEVVPDGDSVPEDEQKVNIWDPNTYSLVGSWGIKQSVYGLNYKPVGLPRVHALSPDAVCLVSSYGDTILIHDAHIGEIITTLICGYRRNVSCVAFSPDGTRIASSWDNGSIRLWNVALGTVIEDYVFGDELLAIPDSGYSIAFSPDGGKLVSGSPRGDIHVWDVSTSSRRRQWGKGDASKWPSITDCFLPHPIHSSWVSHDQRSLTLWLPDHYQRKSVPNLLLRMSREPMIHIDFSKFVHGTDWTSVISEEALRSCRRPNAA